MTTASEYQDFIYRVCEALDEADGIVAYRNKTYTGRVSRRKITMEVSFEGQLLGVRILGLVECKCYKSRVEVSDVEGFHSKLDDIGAHKGIMFTTVGYEAGAKNVAKGRGIALFMLREGQEPGECRVETKAEKQPTTPSFLRSSFLPSGHVSESHDEIGYRVESADEFFYILAFSEVDRFDEPTPRQQQG